MRARSVCASAGNSVASVNSSVPMAASPAGRCKIVAKLDPQQLAPQRLAGQRRRPARGGRCGSAVSTIARATCCRPLPRGPTISTLAEPVAANCACSRALRDRGAVADQPIGLPLPPELVMQPPNRSMQRSGFGQKDRCRPPPVRRFRHRPADRRDRRSPALLATLPTRRPKGMNSARRRARARRRLGWCVDRRRPSLAGESLRRRTEARQSAASAGSRRTPNDTSRPARSPSSAGVSSQTAQAGLQ